MLFIMMTFHFLELTCNFLHFSEPLGKRPKETIRPSSEAGKHHEPALLELQMQVGNKTLCGTCLLDRSLYSLRNGCGLLIPGLLCTKNKSLEAGEINCSI